MHVTSPVNLLLYISYRIKPKNLSLLRGQVRGRGDQSVDVALDIHSTQIIYRTVSQMLTSKCLILQTLEELEEV
jgi:hypothetical protein